MACTVTGRLFPYDHADTPFDYYTDGDTHTCLWAGGQSSETETRQTQMATHGATTRPTDQGKQSDKLFVPFHPRIAERNNAIAKEQSDEVIGVIARGDQHLVFDHLENEAILKEDKKAIRKKMAGARHEDIIAVPVTASRKRRLTLIQAGPERPLPPLSSPKEIPLLLHDSEPSWVVSSSSSSSSPTEIVEAFGWAPESPSATPPPLLLFTKTAKKRRPVRCIDPHKAKATARKVVNKLIGKLHRRSGELRCCSASCHLEKIAIFIVGFWTEITATYLYQTSLSRSYDLETHCVTLLDAMMDGNTDIPHLLCANRRMPKRTVVAIHYPKSGTLTKSNTHLRHLVAGFTPEQRERVVAMSTRLVCSCRKCLPTDVKRKCVR